MAKKGKNKQPPKTIITLEFDGQMTLDEQRQPVHRVEVTARKGDNGYIAEVLMSDFEADLLPVVKHINSVFFQAEVDGLPEFPDMEAPETAPVEEVTSDDDDHTGSNDLPVQHELIEDADTGQTFTVALYGEQPSADSNVEEEHLPEDDQLSLFPDDDYYAALADEWERE